MKKIISVDSNKILRPDIPHSHSFYCFTLLESGQLPHFGGMKQILVNGPAILLLDLNQVHIHKHHENAVVFNYAFEDIMFSENEINSIYKLYRNNIIRLKPKYLKELKTYTQLLKFSNSHFLLDNTVINKNLINIIVHLSLGYAKLNTSLEPTIYVSFIEHLNKYYKTNYRVSFYADKLSISEKQLSSIIKKHTQFSPKQIISQKRITEAKRLIYWTEMTMKEISHELGFETDAYFNRFFKKKTGKSPKAFKASLTLSEKDNKR